MTLVLLLSFLATASPAQSARPDPGALEQEDPAAVFARMRAEAGQDVPKLWKAYDYCEAFGLEKEGRSVLRDIVEIDGEDKKARGLLGHVYYDGQWFTSESKLEAYKRAEEERMAKEQGLARFEDQWVPIEDLDKYERGLVPLGDGRWVTPDVKAKVEAGWKPFDMTWVSPEDYAEKIEKGLFPCGDQWLPEAEADKYHSEILRWWEIPLDRFVAYSTLSRATTLRALNEMERTFGDLKRIFGGVGPSEPLVVIVLNSAQQYNAFAGASPQSGQIPPESSGKSAFYHAFTCESWIDLARGTYPGAGCGFWDELTDFGNSWGPLSVRHAAGHAYIEAIDPSPKTTAAWLKNPTSGQFPSDAFWAEKKLPQWLRYGAAAYVERYFLETGAADPMWARKWSAGEITRRGGLDDLAQVFAFNVSSDSPEAAEKLINEAGLIVAFVIDGKIPAIVEKHAAVKQALNAASPDGLAPALQALQDEIIAREGELRAFAGL